MVVQYSDEISAAVRKVEETARRHAESIGFLSIEWSYLDGSANKLFEPLLECTESQVSCILVENISTKCEMLKKLLYNEDLPEDWRSWVCELLVRAKGELAEDRNRIIHDQMTIRSGVILRTDKRSKVKKAQSHQRPSLSFNIEHKVADESIDRLRQRVHTVFIALCVAGIGLVRWRSQGQTPTLDPQWLPASKPKARCLNFQVNLVAFERPAVPLTYEFD